MVKKRRPLLLAFCIPVAILFAAIVYKGIYPFGDRCFLRVDMYNQYLPFFTEFHRKLQEGESLFFSWRAGLGANFVGLYAYYLASPMNWLLVFCPQECILEFMTVLILVKTGLCGLSFAWYLKRHFGTESYGITLFSAFYALSGFMSAYNWNIMWLDCIFITPVIILGLEMLVWENRPFLYVLSLGFSILTNYYISIFICIFLVLYYMVLALPLPFGEKCRSMKQFLLYSLLGGGLAGGILVPGILAICSTRFGQVHFPDEIRMYFQIWDLAARHCMNVPAEIRSDHWPNLYCGAAVFLLFPLYLCCRQIRWKEKLPRLALVLFFLLSFSVNLLDFLWHGLNFPDNLPARQSFLYIFVVLTLCFEAVLHLRAYSSGQMVTAWGGGLLALILCCCFGGCGDVTIENLLFTILYSSVYGLLLYWYVKGGARYMVWVLFFCVVIVETATNTIETSLATTSRSAYMEDIRTNEVLLQSLEERDGFFRIEEQGRMTKNDGMLGGFPTATLFSSTVNGAMSHFYRRVGMSSSKVFYSYDGATPLMSALLSVQYTLADSLEMTDDFHELLKAEGDKYLYRNRYTLPAGFMVDTNVCAKWITEEGGPVTVQNSLAKALGIEEPLYESIPVTYENGTAILEAEQSGYVYIYPHACSTRDIAADIEGYEKIFERVYYPYLLNIGWCNAGSRVRLTQSGDKRNEKNRLELSAYRLNPPVLEEMLRRLGREPMEVLACSDTGLTGRVETQRAGLLVTSVPGEAGWKAEVDGKPAKIRLFGGVMAGVELSAGQHTVSFRYIPPGLYAGWALSLVSAVALAILWFRNRRNRPPVSGRHRV